MSKLNIELLYEELLKMTDDEIIEATKHLTENIIYKSEFRPVEQFDYKEFNYSINVIEKNTVIYDVNHSSSTQKISNFDISKILLAS